jgi:hypothetical protein
MGPRPATSGARRTLGVALAVVGALVAFGGGNLVAAGQLVIVVDASPNVALALVVLPGLVTAVLGLALL